MDYTKIPLGAIPSPPDERDFPITKLVPRAVSFPEEFILHYNHEIKNQGTVNSCVAHSLAYCREIVEEQQLNEYKKMSVGFIYGNRSDTDYQGEGWHPREALNHLLKEGACEYDLFPYNEEYPGIREKVLANKDALLKNALPHRITAYARLYTLDDIRTTLIQLKSPVTFIMKICPSFYQISPYNPAFTPPSGSEALYGLHEMTITGWKKRNGQDVLVVLNSWGEEWGAKGFFYVPFSVFDAQSYYFVEIWSITDKIFPGGDEMSAPYDRNIQAIVIHHMGDGKPPGESILNRWNPYNYQYPEYDFGIEADGTIRVGRPLNIIGAHCQSDIPPFSERGDNWWNKNSIGIGLAGDFTLYAMQWAQYEALLKLVRELMAKYNVSEIRAHKEVTRTACPGNWDTEAFKKDLEGSKVFENLVCYDWYDDGAAKLLADKLKAPVVHVDNVTDALWSCAKKKYKVGGGAFRDAQVIAGKDRFATTQAVLNL